MQFNKFKFVSLRGETVHFVNCKRNRQQAKIRFVSESSILKIFSAVSIPRTNS